MTTAIRGNAVAPVYNIKEYGTVADTTQLSTAAIQRAIDECHANRGGVVWVPGGDYLTTALVLKSNVNLHLDAGSTLYASLSKSEGKSKKVKVGASDASETHVIVMALDAENISITGTGALHC
ncbi:MAG: hypothetical protein LUD15_05630 [Bacteroides sp.]|nr:hypothetical protein [Bacteroides sp.]